MTNQEKIPELLKGKGLPNFKDISPSQINELIPVLIKSLEKEFNVFEEDLNRKIKGKHTFKWDEIFGPHYEIIERLRWSWGVVGHLNGVCNSSELREAYSKQQQDIVRFSNQIGQSKVLYEALKSLQSSSKTYLEETQQRIIKSELTSMKVRGVGLEREDQELFNERAEKLAELSTKFSNNVLDATNEWSVLFTDEREVEGLPQRALEIMAAAAKEHGDKYIKNDNLSEPTAEKGPWRVGLDLPRYMPYITYAKQRSSRELIYKAFVSRASKGKLSNQKIIQDILSLREKQAIQLGYKNWAEVSLESKMAKDIKSVENLLNELLLAALPSSKKELKALKDFAQRNGSNHGDELTPWDINYWSEKLKEEKFKLDQEALRPWFPLNQVLDGLFTLCNRLFDISIVNADGEAPVWNKDVKFFKVKDKKNKHIASFYLDPFSRPQNKRGGAWMDECLSKETKKDGSEILPVAYLICNQTPPVGSKPSLMSFEEVETLFHEFGHGLQHMLTTVNYPQAAGINNVEWDAVELPSQFMENWCLDPSTIKNLAKHWETGEPLPEKEFKKLVNSRKFNAGLATLRQVHFALTDLKLHSEWKANKGITPDELRREIANTTTVIPPIKEDQFLCAFSHIFAGGYAAGYYSYKWAEVLSADAFSAFEEVGLDNEQEIRKIGKKYRDTILSLGGSKEPEKIFISFRGREPKSDALIRHCGLTTNYS